MEEKEELTRREKVWTILVVIAILSWILCAVILQGYEAYTIVQEQGFWALMASWGLGLVILVVFIVVLFLVTYGLWELRQRYRARKETKEIRRYVEDERGESIKLRREGTKVH